MSLLYYSVEDCSRASELRHGRHALHIVAKRHAYRIYFRAWNRSSFPVMHAHSAGDGRDMRVQQQCHHAPAALHDGRHQHLACARPAVSRADLTCGTGDTHCTLLVSLQESVSCMASLVLDSLQHTHDIAQPDIRSVMGEDDLDDRLACKHVS